MTVAKKPTDSAPEVALEDNLPLIIAQWHAGMDLSIKQLEVLHRAMQESTVDQMIRSYEFVGRVA